MYWSAAPLLQPYGLWKSSGCVSLQATLFLSSLPYTLFVDANSTVASGLVWRVASRTFSVPLALTSKSVTGSVRLVVTATCAARCRIASWWLTYWSRLWAFLTSSFMKVTSLGWASWIHFRLRSVPGRLRLSRSDACQPSSIRCAAALTPRKPAPPVISTRREEAGTVIGNVTGYARRRRTICPRPTRERPLSFELRLTHAPLPTI